MNKKKIASFFLLTSSFFLAFLILELFSRIYYKKNTDTLWKKYENSYTKQWLDPSGSCSFSDSLVPHPFFAFVHHKNGPCGIESNSTGILDHQEFPAEKNPHFFTIVVLGGSVASQLTYGSHEKRWLEDFLNTHYTNKKKQPFRIISGALGAWAFPNQTTLLSMYGPAVDAVIAIDGYNEALPAKYYMPIYTPDWINYQYTIQQQRKSLWDNIFLSCSKQIRALSFSWSPLKKSHALFVMYDALVQKAFEKKFNASGIELLEKFVRPTEKTPAYIDAWNRDRYQQYIVTLASIAGSMQLPYAHFLQPIRWIDKALSEEEKLPQEVINPEQYKNIFLAAQKKAEKLGYHTRSLTGIYADHRETIYGDNIHCKVAKDGSSIGYEIMAKEISKTIARLWNFSPK